MDLKTPVFVGLAETDVFTPFLNTDMLSRLPESGTKYKISVYGGTKHGLASRADPKNENEMAAFKQAFDDGLTWLEAH